MFICSVIKNEMLIVGLGALGLREDKTVMLRLMYNVLEPFQTVCLELPSGFDASNCL